MTNPSQSPRCVCGHRLYDHTSPVGRCNDPTKTCRCQLFREERSTRMFTTDALAKIADAAKAVAEARTETSDDTQSRILAAAAGSLRGAELFLANVIIALNNEDRKRNA